MHAAGARATRADDDHVARSAPGSGPTEPQDREAVLLQWERKLEQEERRGRFERSERSEPVVAALPAPAAAAPEPAPAQRRTVVITGQPVAARRTVAVARRHMSLAERHITAQPDRIALWAFLLGLLLVAVAAGTAHA